MKKKRGIQSFLVLLMAIICMVVPFSVEAATQTQDGLTVSLTTDKENYAQDEDIQVILSVTNEGNDPVSNISLENIIPEGYDISDGSSQEMQLDMLETGETVNLETVYSPSLEEDTEPTEDTEIQSGQSDKNDEDTNDSDSAKTENNESENSKNKAKVASTGDDTPILLFVIALVISVIIIIALAIFKKKRKMFGLFLGIIMAGSMVMSSDIFVEAAEANAKKIEISTPVTIDGKDSIIEASVLYTISTDVPQESEITYSVNFESNGGSEVSKQEVPAGGVANEPETPVRDGYKFLGWFSDYELKEAYDFETEVTGDITLFAAWERTNMEADSDISGPYAVAFDLNYNGCEKRTEQLVDEGMNVNKPSDPARSGYEFVGWYTSGSDSHLYDFDTPVYKSMVLYAKWNAVDSDGDGANDLWETANGYDPNYYDAEFNVTGSSTDGIISASVNLNLKGNQADSLLVTPISNGGYFTENIPGYMGSAFDFEVEGYFDSAVITFTFDPSNLSDSSTAVPTVYYLNEEAQTLEPQETTVSGNTASITVDHFSTYILLNKTDFDQVWNADIRPPEEIPENEGLDVVFVIDSSGSMSSNDGDELRLDAARAFVDKLSEKDRAAVIDFDGSAQIYQTFTNDKEALYAAIGQVDSSGSTNLGVGISTAINQFIDENYDGTNTYKYIIMLTDGNGDYDAVYTTSAAENGIIIYTVGLGNGVDETLLQEIAAGTGGKYYFASEADALSEIYEAIAGETVDYLSDSNNDMISDYFTQKLCEGILTYGSGSPTEFAGIPYEDIQANDDYDGDGIKNGEELEVYYDEEQQHIFVYYHSNPVVKEEVTSWHATDSHFNSGNVEGGEIFNKKTEWFGLGDDTFEYNGSALAANHGYSAPGDTKIDIAMTIPKNADVTIDGDLDITADITLEAGASLTCTGDMKVKSHITLASTASLKADKGELKVNGGNGILDMKQGGLVSCNDFFFDSGTSHAQYLKAGVIQVSQDVEIRENFYASGTHEFQIVTGVRHTVNMWAKIIDEPLHFNIFRVVGNGIEVLDVKEPFRCYNPEGFIMDDWSWLKLDYYGEDFQFTDVQPNTSELQNILQTGVMLAIAREGEKIKLWEGIDYISVNVDSFSYQICDPKTKKLNTYTLQNVNISGEELTGGSAIAGQFNYNGRLYAVSMKPELMVKIWEDFKDTATIGAIKEVGDVYLGAYKNLIKATINEFLPKNISDSLEMTKMIKDCKDILRKYYELGQ